MTPEGRVKKEIKKILDSYGTKLVYFMPPASPYGQAGIADFVCCVSGRYLEIEAKAEDGRVTTIQKLHGKKIEEARGIWITVYPSYTGLVNLAVDALLNYEDRLSRTTQAT